MPIDHGDLPLDVAATWTVIAKNTPKKQASLYNQGQYSKKSNRNAQVFGEFGKINNMPIDHGGSESLANHHRDTTTKLFAHGLLHFKASIDKRMKDNLHLEIIKSLESSINSVNALCYDIHRNMRRKDSFAGNKHGQHGQHGQHVAGSTTEPTTKPAPTKRQKKSHQFAAVETTTALSKVSNYSFRVRNSMFPDPNNCESFNLNNSESLCYRPHRLIAATITKESAAFDKPTKPTKTPIPNCVQRHQT